MIGANAVTAWGLVHPWRTLEQVEQDLLLSRAICEIANHPYLGEELCSEAVPRSTSSISAKPCGTARISTTCGPRLEASARCRTH